MTSQEEPVSLKTTFQYMTEPRQRRNLHKIADYWVQNQAEKCDL